MNFAESTKIELSIDLTPCSLLLRPSLDVPGNRKTFSKPFPEPKNGPRIEPPAGHMTCMHGTVYIGHPIIMNRHHDGYGHPLSGMTSIHHT